MKLYPRQKQTPEHHVCQMRAEVHTGCVFTETSLWLCKTQAQHTVNTRAQPAEPKRGINGTVPPPPHGEVAADTISMLSTQHTTKAIPGCLKSKPSDPAPHWVPPAEPPRIPKRNKYEPTAHPLFLASLTAENCHQQGV